KGSGRQDRFGNQRQPVQRIGRYTGKSAHRELGNRIGTTKKAPFDVSYGVAMDLLRNANPHRKPNSDVVFPYANGMTITRRWSDQWIIDFAERAMEEASKFSQPFEHAKSDVLPLRREHREPRQKEKWWLLA